MPNTWSPTLNSVTPGPTASTTPARSTPRTGCFGRRKPVIGRIITIGSPRIPRQSSELSDAARMRTRIGSVPISGLGVSVSSRTAGEPYRCWATTFMVFSATRVVSWVRALAVIVLSLSPATIGWSILTS